MAPWIFVLRAVAPSRPKNGRNDGAREGFSSSGQRSRSMRGGLGQVPAQRRVLGKLRRRQQSGWQVAGLAPTGSAAYAVAIAPRTGLGGHANIHDIALHQNSGIHNVEVGAENG